MSFTVTTCEEEISLTPGQTPPKQSKNGNFCDFIGTDILNVWFLQEDNARLLTEFICYRFRSTQQNLVLSITFFPDL